MRKQKKPVAMEIKPKQLRKVTTGQIFGYTEALARRPDMVPVWADGVDPNTPQKPGLSVDGARSAELVRAVKELQEMLDKADETIQEKNGQLEMLQGELSAANAQVLELSHRLSAEMSANENKDSAEVDDSAVIETSVATELSRQDKIDLAVAEIYTEGNKSDFTRTDNLPKIPSVEARCGFDDVSAKERDAAVEAYRSAGE